MHVTIRFDENNRTKAGETLMKYLQELPPEVAIDRKLVKTNPRYVIYSWPDMYYKEICQLEKRLLNSVWISSVCIERYPVKPTGPVFEKWEIKYEPKDSSTVQTVEVSATDIESAQILVQAILEIPNCKIIDIQRLTFQN